MKGLYLCLLFTNVLQLFQESLQVFVTAGNGATSGIRW